MVWLAIIGSASIQIRADDKYFEPDVQRAVKRIKNVTIQLKADVDLTKASKKIRDLRYRITSKDAVLKVDANVAKAEAKLAKLLAKFIDKNMEFTATANTQGANTKLTELRDRFKNNRVSFTANADTAAARAALNTAARNRTSTIRARVDPVTMGALQGLFNTLTGTLPYEKIKASIAGVAANFEGLATKGTAVVAVLGAISAAVLTAGANLLSIGGDITQVIGIAGVFPAALFGVVTAVKATTMAWKGFGDAMKEAKTPAQLKAQQAALAKLPPEAREAVKALKAIRGEIQKPVQKAYWEAMGTSLQDLIDKKFPELKAGMTEVGGAMGRYTSKLFDAIGNTGDFSGVFANVRDSVDNLAKGLEPAIDALSRWINVGSTYLPKFGDWVSNLSTKFAEWTKNAEETGKMNEWINTGIQRIQELGSIVKSTAGFFSGLATAARIAGAPGLTEMAAGMRDIRDIVNGEPFQSRLVTILEGARVGTEALGEGFKKLTSLIGESSSSIGYFLGEAGKVGGKVFEDIRAMFDGTGLGSGLITAVKGLGSALDILKPGFADLGGAVGSMGEIAAAVLIHMAPSLNQLFDSIDKIIGAVKQGVIDAMPVFNDFMQNLMAAAQGPVVAFATAIGDILTGFSKMPGAVQTMIMSIGLFLLLKNRLTGFFTGMGKSLNDEKTSIGKAFTGIRTGASQMRSGVADSFSTLGASMKNALVTSAAAGAKAFSPIIGHAEDVAEKTRNAFGVMRSAMRLGPELDTVRTGFQNLRTNVSQTMRGMGDTLKGVGSDITRAIIPAGLRDAASRVHADLAPARQAFANLAPAAAAAGRQAGSALATGLKTATAGLFGALGGIWGVGIMLATIAISEFASQNGKAKAQVDNLAAAFATSGGRIDSGVRKVIDANLNMKKSFLWMEFDSGMDIAKKINVPLKDVVEAAAGVPGAMEKVQASLAKTGNASTKFGTMFGASLDVLKKGGGIVGGIADLIDKSGLFRSEGDKLNEVIVEQKRVMDEAQRAYEKQAEALGIGTVAAKRLAENYDVLRDSASSVSSRVEALKDNLDILNGSMQAGRKAGRDHAETMFKMDDAMKTLHGATEDTIDANGRMNDSFRNTLLNVDGTFSTANRSAIDFSKEMDNVATSIITLGMQEMKKLQDAGKSLPQAQAGAMDVMNKATQGLRDKLGVLGFDAGKVNAIISQLGLDPDKLMGALVIDTKSAEAEVMRFDMFKEAVLNKNWEVALTASSEGVKNTILSVDKYREAYKNGGWEAVVKLRDQTGKGFSELMTKIALAKDESEVTALLKAEFPDAGIFEQFAAKGRELDNKVLTQKLEAQDNASPVFDAAKAKLRDISEGGPVTKEIKAIDSTLPARETAIANMDIPDSSAFLFGVDQTAPGTESAQITMNGLQDVWRWLTSADGTDQGVAAAQGTMNTLQNVSRWLEAVNMTGDGKVAAQATIDLLKGKEVKLSADDQASGVIQKVDNTSIGAKTFSIIGVLSGVSQAVRDMLGMANGGLMKGGIQTFANGGLTKPNVKAFASGGVENHVAQIAKGAWPVRVWAEPETGGEAYIPLGLNKRKRSLEILRQVMAEFGLSHLAKFADGGVMKNMPASPRRSTAFSGFGNSGSIVTGTTRSGAAPTFITNVYPSPGLNEEQIGESAMSSLYWKLSTQI